MSPANEVTAIIDSLQRCGLSLPEIARQSGISRTSIFRGATGQMSKPSYRYVTSLQTLAEKIGPPPPTGSMVRR